jgi:hypothetical protein
MSGRSDSNSNRSVTPSPQADAKMFGRSPFGTSARLMNADEKQEIEDGDSMMIKDTSEMRAIIKQGKKRSEAELSLSQSAIYRAVDRVKKHLKDKTCSIDDMNDTDLFEVIHSSGGRGAIYSPQKLAKVKKIVETKAYEGNAVTEGGDSRR